jgi:hypothetical protein
MPAKHKRQVQPLPSGNGQHARTDLSAESVTLIVLLSALLPASTLPLQPAVPFAVVGQMKPVFGSACNVITVPTGSVIVLLTALAPFGSVVLAGVVTARLHQASKLAMASVAVGGEFGGGGGGVVEESDDELQLATSTALARATTMRFVMATTLLPITRDGKQIRRYP